VAHGKTSVTRVVSTAAGRASVDESRTKFPVRINSDRTKKRRLIISNKPCNVSRVWRARARKQNVSRREKSIKRSLLNTNSVRVLYNNYRDNLQLITSKYTFFICHLCPPNFFLSTFAVHIIRGVFFCCSFSFLKFKYLSLSL